MTANLSAPCALLLPVATPPNAIVFGACNIPISKRVKARIVPEICCAIVAGAHFVVTLF